MRNYHAYVATLIIAASVEYGVIVQWEHKTSCLDYGSIPYGATLLQCMIHAQPQFGVTIISIAC